MVLDSIKFENLYEEVWAYIDGKDIYFPQNFTPDGSAYPCSILRIRPTMTGKYKFEGVVYNVIRVYHNGYDIDGTERDKTCGFIESWNEKAKLQKEIREASKDTNPFSDLVDLKELLPQQKKEIKYVKPTKKFEFQKGMSIVRPMITYTTGEYEDRGDEVVFKLTDKGSYMFFADAHNEYCPNPVAANSGMACFTFDRVESGWTHFIVIKVAASGRALFVEPCYGSTEIFKFYGVGLEDIKC